MGELASAAFEALANHSSVGIVAWVIFLVLIVNFLATFTSSIRTLNRNLRDLWGTLKGRSKSRLELAGELNDLSKELFDFCLDRRSLEPIPDRDNWADSTREIVLRGAETQGLYAELFRARVAVLRDEARRHGMKSERLDTLFEHGTNELVIREVGAELSLMAERLRARHAA